MASYVEPPRDPAPIDAVELDKAFLSIPDEGYEPIIDARKTFWITAVSAAVFIAIVILFVL